MPRLNQEKGGFALGPIVRYYGSFKYTAAGNVVDTIRDGASKCFASVSRVSAGLYEITLAAGVQLPTREIFIRAFKSAGSATPAKACNVEYVAGTYDTATRKFRILCTVVGDTALSVYTDPAPGDPDDGCRFGWELVGSISSLAGLDPA